MDTSRVEQVRTGKLTPPPYRYWTSYLDLDTVLSSGCDLPGVEFVVRGLFVSQLAATLVYSPAIIPSVTYAHIQL